MKLSQSVDAIRLELTPLALYRDAAAEVHRAAAEEIGRRQRKLDERIAAVRSAVEASADGQRLANLRSVEAELGERLAVAEAGVNAAEAAVRSAIADGSSPFPLMDAASKRRAELEQLKTWATEVQTQLRSLAPKVEAVLARELYKLATEAYRQASAERSGFEAELNAFLVERLPQLAAVLSILGTAAHQQRQHFSAAGTEG